MAAAARFNEPVAVASAGEGGVLVADRGNHLIRKIDANGVVTTVAGVRGGSGNLDGPVSVARFNQPSAIAVDGAGKVYVADTGNRTIRVVSGDQVSTVAGSAGEVAGVVDGVGSAAAFVEPTGLAMTSDQKLYIAERSANVIRRMDDAYSVVTVAGVPFEPNDGGPGATVIGCPAGIAQVEGEQLVVADACGNALLHVDVLAGEVTVLARHALAASQYLQEPVGVALLGADTLVSARADNIIARIVNTTYELIAGTPGAPGSEDHDGGAATFASPSGIAVDELETTLWVADRDNHAIRAVELQTFRVATVAGLAPRPGSSLEPVRLNSPRGLALLGSHLLVADAVNGSVRRVPLSNPSTSEVFGNIPGQPFGITVTAAGRVYVSDSARHVVYRHDGYSFVVAGGLLDTAGNADGQGGGARFNEPRGLAALPNGDVLIADHSSRLLRKLSPDDTVVTVLMQPVAAFDPRAVAVGADGTIYVVDSRRVFTIVNGVSSVLAGDGTANGALDGTGAGARFNTITGMTVAPDGTVFVADHDNHAVRQISAAGVVTTLVGVPIGGAAIGFRTGPLNQAALRHPHSLLWIDGHIFVSVRDENCIARIE